MPPNNEMEHESIEVDGEEVPRRRKTKVFDLSRSDLSLNQFSDEEVQDVFYEQRRGYEPQQQSYSNQNPKPQVPQGSRMRRSVSTDHLNYPRRPLTDSYYPTNPDRGDQRRRHVSTATAPGGIRRINTISDFDPRPPLTPMPARRKKMSQISTRNGNMVLQLVLPGSNRQSGIYETNNNYLSVTSSNTELGANIKNRLRQTNFNGSQSDLQTNFGYTNSTYNGDDFDYHSMQMPAEYVQNNSSETDENHEESPTPPDEKSRMSREYLSKILSCVYALFIVTLGLVVYISDVVIGNSPVAETFSLYLVIIAFIFLAYLITDIRIYMNKKNEYYEAIRKCTIPDEIEYKEFPEGGVHLSIPLPQTSKLQKPLPHHYCLSKGRHSGSFYLKIGAAGFCLGHLVHSGLIVGYQIVFLTSDGDTFYECASVATLILDIIYPIYSFVLLYFIFKYSNVIINRHVPLARFGLMHCISSSLCFWVWTILRETMDSLSSKGSEIPSGSDGDDDDGDDLSLAASSGQSVLYFGADMPIALPLTSYNKKGAKNLVGFFNQSMRLFAGKCDGDEGLSIIYKDYSPYLYPFTVEYSILVVGVLFVIWQYIGSCKNISADGISCPNTQDFDIEAHNKESNLVLHADFHSSNKGLFSGIIVIVISVVSIILFFISLNDVRFLPIGLWVNNVTNTVFLVLMAITGIFAYHKITKLDINRHPISLLDDILIFVCIPAFFLDAIFSIVPAVRYESAYGIAFIIVEIIQMLVQTPLIIDGLRRCSNSPELRQKKPGRELITFLIVCNVALWLTQTFEVKGHGLQDHRYDFYGKVLWTIIGHMTLPLIMFYRFHSSVCLVDIWKYAYEPASH